MSHIFLIILPLVAIGIALILFINTIKKRNEKRKYLKDNQSNNKENDYMALGICFGVAIGMLFTNSFGAQSISYGICFGMIIGMTIKRK